MAVSSLWSQRDRTRAAPPPNGFCVTPRRSLSTQPPHDNRLATALARLLRVDDPGALGGIPAGVDAAGGGTGEWRREAGFSPCSTSPLGAERASRRDSLRPPPCS